METIVVSRSGGKWKPVNQTEWEKFGKIRDNVLNKWTKHGNEKAFVGLYFAGNQMGSLEIRADHQPDADVPEQVSDYLNTVKVKIKGRGGKLAGRDMRNELRGPHNGEKKIR